MNKLSLYWYCNNEIIDLLLIIPIFLQKLLLHHVVPGAFRVYDLMAGDEMTGVSLAGTQLRANLYARQRYDNRWNDIEVIKPTF